MAYPFTEMPTLGEFLTYLQGRADCTVERHVSYVQITCTLADGGQPVRIGKESPENSVLLPRTIALFCHRLGIPLEDFIPPLNGDENVSFGKYPKKPK